MIEDTELYEAFQTLLVNPDSIEEFAEKKVKESEDYRDLKPRQLKNLQSSYKVFLNNCIKMINLDGTIEWE